MTVMLGKFYLWLWFHTEFWLTRIDRRPYTFIMRDWMYKHGGLTRTFIVLFYAGSIILSNWHGTASTITVALGSFVLAHLVWGTVWIEGEQESPAFLG